MKKEYKIKTRGPVQIPQEVNYLIVADSENEAMEIAKQNFVKEYEVINSESIGFDLKKRNRWGYWASIILLATAFFLSFIGWRIGHETISITPGITSTIYAVVLHSVFVIRTKGLKSMQSLSSLISSILCVLVISSLFQAVSSVSFFGIDFNVLIWGAILISALGVKIVSCIMYILVFVAILYGLTKLNYAMDIWGAFYIISAYFGILFTLASDPYAEDILKNAIQGTKNGFSMISGDFREASSEVKKGSSKIVSEIKETIHD